MPQYREKSEKQSSFGVGLLTYPVLQSADILLYQADLVPVGEDQRQHLELARDLAQRFNNRYGDTFTVPKGTFPEVGAKITDLQDPTSRKTLKSAVTDSGRDIVRADDKPGVTNLIEILAASTGRTPEQVEKAYEGAGYGQLKGDVAEAIVELLAPIQSRYEELRSDRERLDEILAVGAGKAHEVAAETLRTTHQAIGFV
jgi:tryptophanyl-tRNA synthetase